MGFRLIDISNPAAPIEVGFYDTPGYTSGVAAIGNYAYVADGEGGLVILRMTVVLEKVYLPLALK
jgi:hypothetical protein